MANLTGTVPGDAHGPNGESPNGLAADDIARTVAVLPFVNLSDDPDQSHLSDGVAEDASIALASMRDLLVTGWGSSVACRPFAGDVPRVAAELGVAHVVEGSVRRIGDRLQVVASLHDSRHPQPIWTERFETWVADAPAVAGEIGRLVAARIVPDRPWAGAAAGASPDPQTNELVLRARAALLRGGNTDDLELISKGIALAQTAANRDRRWGEAQRCVAWGYCLRAELGRFEPQAQADYEAARQVVQRLRDAEPGGVAAHAMLGHIAMRQMRHEDALTSLRLAHDLEPHAVMTLRWLSWEEANHELTDDAFRTRCAVAAAQPLRQAGDPGPLDPGAGRLCRRPAGDRRHARPPCAGDDPAAFPPVHYIVLAACLAELGELSEAHYTLVAAQAYGAGAGGKPAGGHLRYFVRPGPDRRRPMSARCAWQPRATVRRRAGHGPGRLPRPANSADAVSRALGNLTAREREVLALVASGQSNAEIATRLGISDHTAKRHVANVLARLQLPTRGAAATLAARHGLI